MDHDPGDLALEGREPLSRNMPIGRHHRVKRAFLGALERSGADRAEYLRLECGSDREVRRDVDKLLASHTGSTVLFEGGRLPGQPPTSGSFERFSKLFDLLAFLFGTTTRRRMALAVILSSAIAIGYWTRTEARDMLLVQAGTTLQAVLGSSATAFLNEQENLKSEVGAIVNFPSVARALNALLSKPGTDAWNRFDRLINPLLSGRRYHSYFVISGAGDLIATSSGPRQGKATPSGMAAIGRANHGRGTVEFPSPGSDFGEPPDQGDVWPRIVVLVPIQQPDRRTTGAFALVLPMDEIGEQLRQGRPFHSGETYLFRENGLLLSPSRFEPDMERWKLARPAGNLTSAPAVYLRDPGRNLYESNGPRAGEDPTTWPLTEMVRVAVARRRPTDPEASGVILTSYRDYRGVRVLSAWKWSPELRVGLAAEVDEDEILLALRFIDRPIGLLTLLLAGAGVWSIVSSLWLTQLRVRSLAGEALGQYTLIEKLGEGGVGEVFLAQHASLRRPAALKLLRRDRVSPAFLRQFEREAQAACRLRHPNTVEIYDFGKTRDGLPYYVMEYIPGMDLGRWVNQHGAMVPARAVHVARQICAALDEAHRQNVIHRDIKPANVMMCELAGQHDFVKILDFGLAKEAGEPGDDTSPLVRSGTPFYTAPERLLPKADVDHRCDIYSIGVLLYFLVCACTPFEPGADWIDSTLRGEPIPPSRRTDLPHSLERIILDCMCREPGGRPGSARELLDRLCRLDDVPPWVPDNSEAADPA